MLKAALYLAMGCAICSALWGCRTAWVLLASAAFCLALGWLDVPFHPILWMLIDLVVVLLLLRPQMRNADIVIVALFIPAWAFYMLPGEQRYAGSMLVTIAQLLLTAPLEKVRGVPASVRAWFAPSDLYDRLVAHVRLAGA